MRTWLLVLALLVGCGSGGGSAPEDDPNVFATEYGPYFVITGPGGDGQTYFPAFTTWERWNPETGETLDVWLVYQDGRRVDDDATVYQIHNAYDPFPHTWYDHPFDVEGWWGDYLTGSRYWVGPGGP